MTCVQCGQKNSDGVKFCSECRTIIAKIAKLVNSDVSAISVSGTAYVSKLIDYLRVVIQCETALIGYSSIIEENKISIENLCVPHSLPAPPSMPLQPRAKKPAVTRRIVIGVIGTIILIIGALGLDGALIIGFIVLIIQALGLFRDQRKATNEFMKEIELFNQNYTEYENHLAHHQKLVKKEALRLSTETAQKKLYEKQTERIKEQITHAKNALSALYGTNILHSKYQNFVAAASIFDYLSTGRTYSLVRVSDDPGAYNIYEDDVRVRRIVNVFGKVGTQIVSVVRGLASDIRSLNMSVCNAIEEASKMQMASSSEVIDGLKSINHSVEINRFNNEVNNRHLEKIAEYSRIQADAQREWTPWGRRVVDKSGFPVD
ncbi:MAG: hypothetical protein FWC77_00635 [Defluviitaleaceae bacterium]|nr:hypothetical protein [Defluviitaleaceae bacterium]